ncbi:response regulator [Planctomycetales bacterium ZRK34]|nr:response regulator [Planctomycetales bacterium ZRK34]
MSDRLVNILIVDDDEVDVLAVRRAFTKMKIANPIHVAPDGLEALRKLRGEGCEPMPRPYLIMLDLNMPRMSGIEFLDALRADPEHGHAVVFVLTSSRDEYQKIQAYDHHVAGYVVKSHMSDDFCKLASMLGMYWQLVELP